MNRLPLVEKYRPKDLNTVIISQAIKDKIKEFLDNKDIPNLLFHGPPGTGKTTLCKIIVNNLIQDKRDLLVLNASDDRSIQVIRDRVTPFIKTKPIKSPFKIVYFEEIASDNGGLTLPAQSSLLNLIEEHTSHIRFLATTNFANKMLPALRSRFVSFKIDSPPKEIIKTRLVEILNQENIEYTDKDIDRLVDVCYPNMRTMLQIIDKSTSNNKINSELIDMSLIEIYYIDKEELAKNFVIYLWKNRHLIDNKIMHYIPAILKQVTSVDLYKLLQYIDVKYTELDLLELIVDLKRKYHNPTAIDIIMEIISENTNQQ